MDTDLVWLKPLPPLIWRAGPFVGWQSASKHNGACLGAAQPGDPWIRELLELALSAYAFNSTATMRSWEAVGPDLISRSLLGTVTPKPPSRHETPPTARHAATGTGNGGSPWRDSVAILPSHAFQPLPFTLNPSRACFGYADQNGASRSQQRPASDEDGCAHLLHPLRHSFAIHLNTAWERATHEHSLERQQRAQQSLSNMSILRVRGADQSPPTVISESLPFLPGRGSLCDWLYTQIAPLTYVRSLSGNCESG